MLGMWIGILNVFCTAPFWRAQVLLMLQSKRQESEHVTRGEDQINGLMDAWKRIVKQDGFSGLYKGVGPSLWLVSNPIIRTNILLFSYFVPFPVMLRRAMFKLLSYLVTLSVVS